MLFIHIYAIITLLLPFSVHSLDADDDHYRDLYFEVLEPLDISYTFRCRPASNFGVSFKQILKSTYLIPTKPLRACSQVQNGLEIKRNIALIERGDCSFVTKIINAQEIGALGVIVMDNEYTQDDRFVDMTDDLTQRHVQIPAMFLQYRDGHMILNSIHKNRIIGARIHIPLNLTYDQMLKVNRAPGSYWL